MIYFVYRYTCIPTGKCYIGVTKKPNVRCLENIEAYKGSTCLYNAAKKYGISNFQREVLFETEDEQVAAEMESRLIISHNTMAPNGYNLKAKRQYGGISAEARKKLSLRMKGIPKSPEHRAKLAEANRNTCKREAHSFLMKTVPKSDEQKRKMSEANKKRVFNGTHNFLDGKHAREFQLKRVVAGTHHFLNSDFNKKPFRLWKNGFFIGIFESKVEAVKRGCAASIIDKLRKCGEFTAVRNSNNLKIGDKFYYEDLS